MDERTKNFIEERIDLGYEFRIGQYLREGWDIYKKNAGGFIAFMFLTFFINAFASLIPFLGLIAVYFILGPALQAGNYIVADKIARREEYSFNSFFRGFDYIGPLALMTLIIVLVVAIIFTPSLFALSDSGIIEWYMTIIQNPFDSGVPEPPIPDTRIISIFLLNMIPLMYIGISYLFAPMFVVFMRAGSWEALESSRRMITRQWFSVFGMILAIIGSFLLVYLLVIGLTLMSPVLGILMMVVTGLGILLISPAIYCVFYAAFADVTALQEGPTNDIEEHLVD